jgi:hypothetical protein
LTNTIKLIETQITATNAAIALIRDHLSRRICDRQRAADLRLVLTSFEVEVTGYKANLRQCRVDALKLEYLESAGGTQHE